MIENPSNRRTSGEAAPGPDTATNLPDAASERVETAREHLGNGLQLLRTWRVNREGASRISLTDLRQMLDALDRRISRAVAAIRRGFL